MKILIIGAGAIGEMHAKVIHLNKAHTIALCDADKARVKKLGSQFGVSEIYADHHLAITHAQAEAAIIATPNTTHAAVAVDALKAGLHVLCEKPMTSSSREAIGMVHAEKDSGRILMIGYILRANHALRRLKQIIDSNALGKLISARVILASPETLWYAKSKYRQSYETGGGIVFDYSHELDYCHLLFGDAARCVMFKKLALKFGETCDDNADMLIEYESGTTVSIHMDYIQEKGRAVGRSIEIVGERGFASCDFKCVSIHMYDGETEIFQTEKADGGLFSETKMFEEQLDTFVRLCHGEKIPHVSGEDGLKLVKLCEALYQSAESRAVVIL